MGAGEYSQGYRLSGHVILNSLIGQLNLVARDFGFLPWLLIALVIVAGPRKLAWLARFRAVQIVVGVLVLGGVAAFLWNRYAATLTTSNLSFPDLTPGGVANEVFWNSGTYIEQVVGELGWLDVSLPPGTGVRPSR